MKARAPIRMVLWAMLGIRGRSAASQDFSLVKPWTLFATFLFLLFALGSSLWALANLAVALLQ